MVRSSSRLFRIATLEPSMTVMPPPLSRMRLSSIVPITDQGSGCAPSIQIASKGDGSGFTPWQLGITTTNQLRYFASQSASVGDWESIDSTDTVSLNSLAVSTS